MKNLGFSLVFLAFLSSCGMSDAESDRWEPGLQDTASDNPSYRADAAGSDTASEVLPPPEEEVEADFRIPQASGRYIYVANSAEDYVVVIDSVSLGLEIVNVGKKPTTVATAGLYNSAMVINSKSKDLSIIKTTPSLGSVVKNLQADIVGLSSIAISPAGIGAVAFPDFDLPFDQELSEMLSYQDVMVVMLGEGEEKSFQKACGYRPREVEYDAEGQKAFVINDDGISIVDFSTVGSDNFPLPIIQYCPDIMPMEFDPVSKDVDISPAGDFAVIRPDRPEESPESYSTTIWVVSLVDGSYRTIELPAVPYDLDLSPDGKFAVAVLPTLSQIALIPLPVDEDSPFTTRDVSSMFVGQVQISGSGGKLALFSNQSGEELVGVYDVAARDFKVISLHKTVKTVAFTPGDDLLVVIHQKEEGSPADPGDPEDVADHSDGYSLVDIASGFVKQQLTKALPEPFLIHPDGSKIYLLQREDALDVREVQVIHTDSFIVDAVRLGSPPVAIGYVPESNKVFVSQDHSAGRITFIDENERTQTVTGFELNDWIVE